MGIADAWRRLHSFLARARLVAPSLGGSLSRHAYLSPVAVRSAASRTGLEPFERLDTPVLRYLAGAGGRDFYCFRRARPLVAGHTA